MYKRQIDDGIDLALRITDTPSPGLHGKPLMPIRHVICATEAYLQPVSYTHLDIVGGFAIMFIIGAIFGEIGKRLPIFNKYIGGAPVMIFLVAAYFRCV